MQAAAEEAPSLPPVAGTPGRDDSFLIVGGGTAGWLAAAILCKAWPAATAPRITVIESPQVGRIGVGESSIPPLRRLLDRLGIAEADWMTRTGATYKCSLHLVDWSHRDGQRDYHHPLFRWGEDDPTLYRQWRSLRQQAESGGQPPPAYDASCFQGVHLARGKRAPRLPGDPVSGGTMQYAYHIDAIRFGDYLREWTSARGVVSLFGNVNGVTVGENGDIDHVSTVEHGDLRAGYYLDCTGFRGLLINDALKEPFVSFAKDLFCDAAVALPTFPDAERDGIRSDTRATALGAGWSWDIPLQQRHGTGYVYASGALSREAAEEEVRAHLGDVPQGEASHLRMRVGHNRRAWVGNCIAVGLAAGFIEPLESTSIFCTQFGIAELLRCRREHREEAAARDAYNARVTEIFEGIRDFIVLHYHLNQRDDSEFWRSNRHRTDVPPAVREIVERWQRDEDLQPVLGRHGSRHLVTEASWHCVLAGLGCHPQTLQRSAEPPPALLAGRMQELAARARDYPDHRAYLQLLAGQPLAGQSLAG